MIVDPDHRLFHDRGLHRTNQRQPVRRLLPHSVSGLSQRLHESVHLRHEARRREAETSSSDVDLLQMQKPDRQSSVIQQTETSTPVERNKHASF